MSYINLDQPHYILASELAVLSDEEYAKFVFVTWNRIQVRQMLSVEQQLARIKTETDGYADTVVYYRASISDSSK